VLLAFNKPFGVLSQFTSERPGQHTLVGFGFPKAVYPIGRLDTDSEGLLLLSDESGLNQRLLNPRYAHQREYWAQVERIPNSIVLAKLQNGLLIQGHKTLPCHAKVLAPQPDVPLRTPPIRFRKTVPTCWISLQLIEGKNRQVRRMTAAIGHPTLRLIRVRIGKFELRSLSCGTWRQLNERERALVMDSR
jgi:23S rRNA pseudouridine2457 synthase